MDGGGFWQYVVMPFGLCTAPVGFEQLMIIALKDILSSVFLGALTVLTTILLVIRLVKTTQKLETDHCTLLLS